MPFHWDRVGSSELFLASTIEQNPPPSRAVTKITLESGAASICTTRRSSPGRKGVIGASPSEGVDIRGSHVSFVPPLDQPMVPLETGQAPGGNTTTAQVLQRGVNDRVV